MIWFRRWICLVWAGLVPLCAFAATFGNVPLQIGNVAINAEVADTPEERAMGLSGRSQLHSNNGMLFVFERPARPQFWMRGTPMALDIAFIDGDGAIADIQSMAPLSDRLHQPRIAVLYALEMPSGWFKKNGIRQGARVTGLKRVFTSEPY